MKAPSFHSNLVGFFPRLDLGHRSSLSSQPVQIYHRDRHILLAAPMPGLEPEDISVSVVGSKIVIKGEERSPEQHGRDVIVDEWTIGSYYREVSLPEAVDGSLTNATYGNGVLVLVDAEEQRQSNSIWSRLPAPFYRGDSWRTGRQCWKRNSSRLEHERKNER